MQPLDRRFASAALVLGLLAACAPIHYTEQEIALRPNVGEDRLDVLIVYRGIHSESDSDAALERQGEFAGRVAGGKRELMLVDWPLHLDLDKLEGETIEPGPWADLAARALECSRGVSVTSSGLCRDEAGRIALFQELRVAGLKRFEALLNDLLRAWLLEVERERPEERGPEATWLDERTRELLFDLARSQDPWLRLDGRGLFLELPMTSTAAARCLGAMHAGAAESSESAHALAALTASLSELEVAGERVRLLFRAHNGVVAFRFARTQAYAPDLAEWLAARERVPEELPLAATILREFEAR